jgi:hypothetical protein
MRATGPMVLLIVACLAFLLPSPAFTQSSVSEAYEPYTDDEFPQWLRDLRRAEVIFIGSFPITLLVATLAYDGFRALRDTILGVSMAERNEFGSYTNEERPWLVVSGLSLSGVITIIDAIIEQRERRRKAEGSQ